MYVAYYKNEPIDLLTCDRKRWQELFIASLKEEITCLHCHTPLNIELSMTEQAKFIHTFESEECHRTAEAFAKKLRDERKETEGGMIRLPKRRVITKTETSNWKEAERVFAIPRFETKQRPPVTLKDPYYEALIERGIMLDDEQWRAVTCTEGPLLILAGAGSGKTRVLTTRAAYMLQTLSPKEMILVTFTAKAAAEMKERMKLYPGIKESTLRQLMIGTFHSIFYKMLVHHDPIRWNADHLLNKYLSSFITEIGREIQLDEREFAFDQALTQISWWKNHLLSPEQVKPENEFEERCAYLYARYEVKKRENHLFDFDDMLLGTYELLNENESLLRKYQRRFCYVSIDEFQDINRVQMEIMSLLVQPTNNLCVVGDDDQSIYSFRGSDPSYILTFKERYPNAEEIILNQNYRSNHEIVSAANNVISTNKTRFHKTMFAQRSSNSSPLLFFPYDEEEEATIVATHIKKKLDLGEYPNEFAILFRTNSNARALVERLLTLQIPFQLSNDFESFYERNAVRKVLAFLRLTRDPYDKRVLRDLIQALFLNQRAYEEIESAMITRNISVTDALSYVTEAQPFQIKKLEQLPSQFKKITSLPPLEAIEYIETNMGLSDYIKKQGKEGNKMERGSDDIRDLKVVASRFQTIESFLKHIDHMNERIGQLSKRRFQSDAVELMTIHRSKGLEFKHVYILSAVEGSIPHDYALDAWREGDEKPLEEERRLMYVAMTRAIEHVYISIPMKRRDTNAFRSRFTREIHRLQQNAISTKK